MAPISIEKSVSTVLKTSIKVKASIIYEAAIKFTASLLTIVCVSIFSIFKE
jgi:hypothetical protein